MKMFIEGHFFIRRWRSHGVTIGCAYVNIATLKIHKESTVSFFQWEIVHVFQEGKKKIRKRSIG